MELKKEEHNLLKYSIDLYPLEEEDVAEFKFEDVSEELTLVEVEEGNVHESAIKIRPLGAKIRDISYINATWKPFFFTS